VAWARVSTLFWWRGLKGDERKKETHAQAQQTLLTLQIAKAQHEGGRSKPWPRTRSPHPTEGYGLDARTGEKERDLATCRTASLPRFLAQRAGVERLAAAGTHKGPRQRLQRRLKETKAKALSSAICEPLGGARPGAFKLVAPSANDNVLWREGWVFRSLGNVVLLHGDWKGPAVMVTVAVEDDIYVVALKQRVVSGSKLTLVPVPTNATGGVVRGGVERGAMCNNDNPWGACSIHSGKVLLQPHILTRR